MFVNAQNHYLDVHGDGLEFYLYPNSSLFDLMMITTKEDINM